MSTEPISEEDERVLAWLKKLNELEAAGERTTVTLGPFTAWTLIGALQLATRHPEMDVRVREIIRDFCRQFEPLSAGTPGEEAIKRGYHPEFDV